MKAVLLTIAAVFSIACSSSLTAPNTNPNAKYIVPNQMIIAECGAYPCTLTVKTAETSKKYEGVIHLNPETQRFQNKIYVTDSWTAGFGGGIAYPGSEQYVTVLPLPSHTVSPDYKIIVKAIGPEDMDEYNSWWWSSKYWDLAVLIGLPILVLIIVLFLTGMVSGMAAEGLQFLETKEGRKLLKKVDKNLRR